MRGKTAQLSNKTVQHPGRFQEKEWLSFTSIAPFGTSFLSQTTKLMCLFTSACSVPGARQALGCESRTTVLMPNHKSGKCRDVAITLWKVIMISHCPRAVETGTRESDSLREQKCTDADHYPDSQWAKRETLVLTYLLKEELYFPHPASLFGGFCCNSKTPQLGWL